MSRTGHGSGRLDQRTAWGPRNLCRDNIADGSPIKLRTATVYIPVIFKREFRKLSGNDTTFNEMHRLFARRTMPSIAVFAAAASLHKSTVGAEDEVLFSNTAKLSDGSGNLVDAKRAVADKHVLLYFRSVELRLSAGSSTTYLFPTLTFQFRVHPSAHWCPPCREFTPRLKEFYEQANRKGKKIEVVFISSDNSEAEAMDYLREKQGDWLCVPFDSPLRWELKRRYGCWAGAERETLGTAGKRSGIPTLVLVDGRSGEELDLTVREKVEEATATGQSVRVDACVYSFAACKRLAALHKEA